MEERPRFAVGYTRTKSESYEMIFGYERFIRQNPK
jgi:hypothetical protein